MEFDQAVAELDTLVGTLEREGDDRALMLLQLIDAVHRPGIELIAQGDLEHPLAQALLSMYDLGEMDDRLEVEEALDEIRPYIESHGGGLELLDVDDGVVHVRMSGSCHGCAASAITLRRGVEEILREKYEGFKEVVAHEPDGGEEATEQQNGNGAGGPKLLQIEDLRKPVFVDVGDPGDIPRDSIATREVDGKSILIANVGGEHYAFKNVCPTDGRSPLDGGRLTASVLVCPWHNCAYDARSGKRADDEPGAESLAVIPIAVRDGKLQIAANVA